MHRPREGGGPGVGGRRPEARRTTGPGRYPFLPHQRLVAIPRNRAREEMRGPLDIPVAAHGATGRPPAASGPSSAPGPGRGEPGLPSLLRRSRPARCGGPGDPPSGTGCDRPERRPGDREDPSRCGRPPARSSGHDAPATAPSGRSPVAPRSRPLGRRPRRPRRPRGGTSRSGRLPAAVRSARPPVSPLARIPIPEATSPRPGLRTRPAVRNAGAANRLVARSARPGPGRLRSHPVRPTRPIPEVPDRRRPSAGS